MQIYRRTTLVAFLLLGAATSLPASAQMPVLQSAAGIQIEYKEPIDPQHRPLYERLKRRMVLEQYKEFMSPLKFKRVLTVMLSGCKGEVNAFYLFRDRQIIYCYEYITHMQRRIAETDLLPGFRREDAFVGDFVNALLHETGHAVFNMFDIPIFGREEDAADAVASYVALRVGPSTARRILTGTAFAWRAQELYRAKNRSPRSFLDYADEHGTEAQRFFNTVCVALGSDMVEGTKTFADFAQYIPERRRAKCDRDYNHVKNAFSRYILPYVDLDLMKKIQAREWLRSEDGSDIGPPPPPSAPTSSPGPGSGTPKGPSPSPSPRPGLPRPQ